MILLFHVLIALLSIIYTTYLYFRPSKHKLYFNYGLIATTIASGTYLAISTHAPVAASCTIGIFYLGIVGAGSFIARYKLIFSDNRPR
jgi:hypothetical protein